MPQTPIVLNYATHRPSRWRQWTAIAILLIASVYAAKRFGPAVARKYQLLAAQRACMNFEPDFTNRNEAKEYKRREVQLAQFLQSPPTACLSIIGDRKACVFVGSIQTNAGERLVILKRIEWVTDSLVHCGPDLFEAFVIEPGSFFSAPKILWSGEVNPESAPRVLPHTDLPFWMGVRDPNDPSRFYLRFSISFPYQATGTFEGWVDDGFNVHLADRSPNSEWQRSATALYGLFPINGSY